MRGYIVLIIIYLFFGLQMQANSQVQNNTKPYNSARLAFLKRQHEDSVKGKLLNAMAQYMWLDVFKRGKDTIPQFNPNGVEVFRLSVLNNPGDDNPANVYKMYNLTERELGTKKFNGSSPEGVAKAIKAALQKDYKNKNKSLPNFQNFQASLDSINKGEKDYKTNPPSPYISEPIVRPVKLNVFQEFQVLPFSIGAILGVLLGGFLTWTYSKSRKPRKLNEKRPGSINSSWVINELEGKNNRLNSDNQLLEENIKILQREVDEKSNLINELQTQLLSLNSLTQIVDSSINQPISEGYNTVEEVFKIPAQGKTCFAPAAEDPFIEQSKVYSVHSGAAAVMLTIDTKNPDRAEFEFSPYADQDHIINTSITQLDQFFEYTLPSRGFSKIKSAGKGTLQLENGYWVRKTKARLELH